MKKSVVATITTILVCLTMLAACGDNAADKAYKDWADNVLPKVEAANADLKAKGEEANGDRETVIAATLEFKAVLEEVTNGLAAIDVSGASADVKTAAQDHLADLQTQLDALNETLANAGISDDGQQEAPEGDGAEAPEDDGVG
jgi:hypothetical protein